MSAYEKNTNVIAISREAPPSKEDFVYETLKEAILSGQLPPGEVLVQTDLAKSLNVSPIPVRTAINRLVSEGLVNQERHRPPEVAQLSIEQLEEFLIIRVHLEVLATREAAGRIDQGLLQQLNNIIEEMDEATQKKDFARYGLLNKQFHLTIYEACPYPLLRQMIKDLWDKSDRSRSRSMFVLVPDLALVSHQEHLHLLESLQKGNTYEAAMIMETHKSRARDNFLKYLRNSKSTPVSS
jgi:DNA-binding GntR family transcriptional regulator